MQKFLMVSGVVSAAMFVTGCFQDVTPGGDDRTTEETSGDGDGDSGDGDGDGEPGDGDGDGEPGDGDGEPGDGDGEPGDGDGEPDPACELNGCPDGEYCISNVCEAPPEGMVAVPAGPFWMGCNEEQDINCEDHELPYHEVTLSTYAIDRTEVTAMAYAKCVDEGACSLPAPTQPFDSGTCEPSSGTQAVGCLTWSQARDYCEWNGQQLPTEAQWEKAARGDDGRVYPWGNQPPTCAQAVIGGCGFSALQPVGSIPTATSPYGALDMAGNATEWVEDWYSASYYANSPDTDPLGPVSGMNGVYRGGAYTDTPSGSLRVSARAVLPKNFIAAWSSSGVRCAYNP